MKRCSMSAMVLAALFSFCATGCQAPGKPGFRTETLRPDQIHDFAVLYQRNCAACHGDGGTRGAAMPLKNPVYLAWAGHDRIVKIVAGGVPHRLMPAFAVSAGGLLTDRQVEDIVNGMISNWGKPDILNGVDVPAYTAADKGNPMRGKVAFQTYCARCHGTDGKGIPGSGANQTAIAGSIVDPTYLSLISDRALRDVVVSGMPGDGMPDWRGDVPGKPMTDREVTDIVAWMVSQRVQFPGQPFPAPQQRSEKAVSESASRSKF